MLLKQLLLQNLCGCVAGLKLESIADADGKKKFTLTHVADASEQAKQILESWMKIVVE